jgi:pantothenate kinase
MPAHSRLSFDQLAERATDLAGRGRRTILGVTGAPGAGKSTVAAALMSQLGDAATIVSMDGFHLNSQVLDNLGLLDRKGAPDTFDVGGYVALLKRLLHQDEDVIYAPEFRRDLEESIGSAVPVLRTTPLVITEGNYLLLGSGQWPRVRELLDEVWFITLPDSVREDRLIKRHIDFGRSAAEAEEWVRENDALNAQLINETASNSDLCVEIV